MVAAERGLAATQRRCTPRARAASVGSLNFGQPASTWSIATISARATHRVYLALDALSATAEHRIPVALRRLRRVVTASRFSGSFGHCARCAAGRC